MQASRVLGLLKSRISNLQEDLGTFFLKQSCMNSNKLFFREILTIRKKFFPQLNETGILVWFVFLPDSLEGYFWSQAYDSMRYQTTLKIKMLSSQESCYCLAGQSVAMASVASSISFGGVCRPTECFSAFHAC